MDSLFDAKIFKTNDPNKNRWRVKRIKDAISTFEKEDRFNKKEDNFKNANFKYE